MLGSRSRRAGRTGLGEIITTRILRGDCRDVLARLSAESVHCMGAYGKSGGKEPLDGRLPSC